MFVLVHSPLLGPVTWSWVAEELRRDGHETVVPDFTHAAVRGGWPACVDAVVQTVLRDDRAALVGHSGAGPLLPVIAAHLGGRPVTVVFVDAAVPPVSGHAPLVPDEFRDRLTNLARDGVLPKWSEWFGAATMEALVPDHDRRVSVVAELPTLPLSYFDEHVPMPAEWRSLDGAYVLLSDPYRPDAAEAASRGWPVIDLHGAHLDIVTRPAEVARAILDVVGH